MGMPFFFLATSQRDTFKAAVRDGGRHPAEQMKKEIENSHYKILRSDQQWNAGSFFDSFNSGGDF